jgi:hypothetical protein
MTKTRFIFQKIVVATMIFASLVTVIPIILMAVDAAIWKNNGEDSLMATFVEAFQTKFEDIV